MQGYLGLFFIKNDLKLVLTAFIQVAVVQNVKC